MPILSSEAYSVWILSTFKACTMFDLSDVYNGKCVKKCENTISIINRLDVVSLDSNILLLVVVSIYSNILCGYKFDVVSIYIVIIYYMWYLYNIVID